jgi:hypothetical protein
MSAACLVDKSYRCARLASPEPQSRIGAQSQSFIAGIREDANPLARFHRTCRVDLRALGMGLARRTRRGVAAMADSVAVGLAAAGPDEGEALAVLVVDEVGVDRGDEARVVQLDREVVAALV